ncbi:twin transmembrane helix small protein [Pelagibacterium sp. 26DY04]|uniref:twin transmembrane helix small protein n=1 Tax=Pelagibacterium sp. 26DY04 TaxID=2967130 RepID=UPI00281512A7|nr:twin transmembrane helix small protein [Pelagibacterium sp. 26DY04]WMT86690.1 twin transmembrane helix small protein [Pelagibacterium sp. 26DY04]
MQAATNILIILAIGATTVILFMGLWNMFKGGSGNTSQKLMRARVIMQAIAVALLMAALFFFGPQGGSGG